MVVAWFALLAAVALVLTNTAYAQITSDQVTLSGDLQNNPVAQEILDKIEKSKKSIAKLQERNFESSERQRELEEKRAEVLEHLNADLKKWEDLWGYYTFDSMLERALEDSPAKDTDTVYDHPYKFTASKINAGRAALALVVESGGSPEEARDAFVKAAKITRSELVTVNAIYNVIHNNAYYNQQILFEEDGQFYDVVSGEQLRKYYQDYRTNPSYLSSNPDDEAAREELSGEKNTECRFGYVLIYRIHMEDYVCVTEQTSEMWVNHGMGKLSNENQNHYDTLTLEKIKQDRINEKTKNINNQIKSAYAAYDKKLNDVQKNYDLAYVSLEREQRTEEKKILETLSSLNKKDISKRIQDIRDQYDVLKENMREELVRSLQILQSNHERDMVVFVSNFESIKEVQIIWNQENSGYKAIRT